MKTRIYLIIMLLLPLGLKAQDGRALYDLHCSVCHYEVDSEIDGSGPRLGGITKIVDSAWFLEFTRNAGVMIGSGDMKASCSWERYKPSLMSDFEHLSDEEINSIYDYIHEVTIREKLTSSFECDSVIAYQRRNFMNFSYDFVHSLGYKNAFILGQLSEAYLEIKDLAYTEIELEVNRAFHDVEAFLTLGKELYEIKIKEHLNNTFKIKVPLHKLGDQNLYFIFQAGISEFYEVSIKIVQGVHEKTYQLKPIRSNF